MTTHHNQRPTHSDPYSHHRKLVNLSANQLAEKVIFIDMQNQLEVKIEHGGDVSMISTLQKGNLNGLSVI